MGRIKEFFKNLFHKKEDVIRVSIADHTENDVSGKYWVSDSNGCLVTPTTTEEWVAIFVTARNHKDKDMMLYALNKAKECCPSSNSNCLTEVFCPECPFGGFEVKMAERKPIVMNRLEGW